MIKLCAECSLPIMEMKNLVGPATGSGDERYYHKECWHRRFEKEYDKLGQEPAKAEGTTNASTPDFGKHYRFSYRGVNLDPYRIISIYGITHPAHQHALKKLLRAGKSVKSLGQDIDEVIASLVRWKEMIIEETPNQAHPEAKSETH